MTEAKKWQLLRRTLKLESPWVTVFADQLKDHTGKELEYWHYDRPDSAVAIAVQGDALLLPAPMYRVGVDEVMLDFAGTRIPKEMTPEVAVRKVVERELGLGADTILQIKSLTPEPLAVDSSFSSQKLHGFVAYVAEGASVAKSVRRYRLDEAQKLRRELRCGQCRLLLDEFLLG